MIDIRQLQRALHNLVTKVRDERLYGILGRREADGSRTIHNELRPGHVYVEMDGGTLNADVRWLGDVALRQGMRVRILVTHEGDHILEGEDYRVMEADPLAPRDEYGVRPHLHTFAALSDTPAAYTGEGGKLVAVKGAEDGLEFIANSGDVGAAINAAPADTPLDADKFGFWDVVDGALKSITWANVKATLKTYFDALYTAIDTAVLLTGAQTVAGVKDFTNGVRLNGGSILNVYLSSTWTPVIADAASGGNVGTAATALGWYTRTGNVVKVWGVIVNINTAGMTAGNTLHIRGLPYTVTSATSYTAIGTAAPISTAFSTVPVIYTQSGVSWLQVREFSSGGATLSPLTVSDFTSGAAYIFFHIEYLVD